MGFCEDNPLKTTAFNIKSESFERSDILSCYLSVFQILAILAGVFALIFYRIFNYCIKRRKCFTVSDFETIQHSFKKAVNRSVAAYVSDRPTLRAVFFLFGNFGLALGYSIYLLVAKMLYNQKEHGSSGIIQIAGTEIFLVVVCNITFIQLFLLVLIGAKVEMLAYTRDPIRSIIMNTDERKVFVRASLKRMLIVTVILFLFPQVLRVILFSDEKDVNAANARLVIYLMHMFILFYYSTDRLSFLGFEKKILRMQKRLNISTLKTSFVVKFLQEHGPMSVTNACLAECREDAEEVRSKIRELACLKINVFEERIELVQNDQSVPMPINTGEISILSKLVIVMYFIMFFPVIALLLSIIEIDFMEWFSNQLFFGTQVLFLVGMLFVNPFITVPLFSSHMMFDSKSNKSEENGTSLEELEAGPSESFDSSYRLL